MTEAQDGRSTDPWRMAWQTATSPLIFGILLLALALALGLIAWLPQAPPNDTSSITYITWQTTVNNRFDGLDTFLETLGLFQIKQAAWFRLLLALIGLSLITQLIEALDALLAQRRAKEPPIQSPALKVDRDMDDVLAELRHRRFRLIPLSLPKATNDADDSDNASMVAADRWPWGDLAPVVIYLGGLILLLGLVLTARSGWRSDTVRLAPGKSAVVEQSPALTFHLDALAADGQSGQGSLRRNGVQVASDELAVGQPLRANGLGVYLVGSGASIMVSGILSDGQPLQLSGPSEITSTSSLTLMFSDEEPRQYLEVPQAGIYLQLTMPRPVEIGAMPQVQAYNQQTGNLLSEEQATASQALDISGVSFEFAPTAHAQITFVHDPGAWWLQVGGILLGAGLLFRGLWPPRRLWVRRQPDGIDVLGDVAALRPNGRAQ